MNKITKGIVAVVCGAVLVGGLTACGEKYTEPFRDADRTGKVNSQPVDIIENADGFSNLSTKCDHGNRIYVAYHSDSPYAAIAVVAKDPTCPPS